MPHFALPSQIPPWALAAAGSTALLGAAFGARRAIGDLNARAVERDLFALKPDADAFSPDLVAALPEPARRYLLHAIAPGTLLAPAVYLTMDGVMTPRPGGSPLRLTAEETLAPRRGFVWKARTHMFGMPVRVRDQYFGGEGSLGVDLLGVVPLPMPRGADVSRSARGRLIAEALWCPTALIGPGVTWEAVDAHRAQFTLAVDGEAVSVMLRVGPCGALREVTLDRWGDVGVPGWQPIPYGFQVEGEMTSGGITIPSRLCGGWWYGTDRFHLATAATFALQSATWACER